jgi:hypothetical protein
MRWTRHVVFMGREEFIQGFSGKARKKETIQRPSCRWDNNINMALRGLCGMDWIHLAHDRDQLF